MKANSATFFDGMSPKDRFLGWSIIFVPIITLVALGAIFLRPNPISADAVLGCYTAFGAPSLDVRRGLIRIDQPQHHTFTYVAEPAKVGYRLTVAPAMSLRAMGSGRYVFVQDERGIGYFWPLLTSRSDDPQYMREPSDYGGRFQLIGDDSKPIIYKRVAKQPCF